MTIKSKPKTRRERIRAWGDNLVYGAEVTRSDLRKLEKLDKILRKDMNELGIKQMSIFIEPTRWGSTSAYGQTLRIKGENKKIYPDKIAFDYRHIQTLNIQELRSMGWHELGHYIFDYYYPEITKWYDQPKQHEIEEAFADEFAYRKFGEVHIDAARKAIKAMGGSPVGSRHMKKLEKMKKHIEQHGYGYWKTVAKKHGISVKYDPKSSMMVGVRPKKETLGNLR